MYKLSEVYGDFKNKTTENAINSLLNTISNNIAHRNYELRLDTSLIWNQYGSISNDYIMEIYKRISKLNSNMNIVNIIDTKLLHSLITGEDSVSYFLIVDNQYKKSIVIYITKNNIGIL